MQRDGQALKARARFKGSEMAAKRKYIRQPVRNKLLADAMHRCCLCPQHEWIIDIHHINRKKKKGLNEEENLVAVCPNCHARIHRIRRMYTVTQIRMYKERWIERCAQGVPVEMLVPSLRSQTPPEPNFVGRKEMLKTITKWYNDPNVRIGALIGWGGVGKSAVLRKWYDSLGDNKVYPDGIFWWGFYRNAYLEPFLNALLRYVSQGEVNPDNIKSNWEKVDRIKEHVRTRAYLIILDGLEEMQESKSGDEFGKMAHKECTELLRYVADAPGPGLCLITTRYPLRDLDNWSEQSYQMLSLIDLSVPDAMAMLRQRGVEGKDDDLKQVIEKYKGHALSLTSVAGYLNRYHDGDINHAPDIEFVSSDKERFNDVNKLLHRYAEKMSEAELAFLNIFSLFRKEVTENEFAGVFRHKIEGVDFNGELVKMSDLDFRDLVDGLVDWRLISYDETKKSYTTHPLIKAYLEKAFYDEDKELCHKRIYQYFGEHAPQLPETLEEMQPLFEQVYHGCGAGLYDEVYDQIYGRRIYRKGEFYITQNLGAWETNLSLLRAFFPERQLSQMPLVRRKKDQCWLLNSAGLSLLSTGRPKEAEDHLSTAIALYVEEKQIGNASVGCQNLAELLFRTGDIKKGIESAKRALAMAVKANRDDYVVFSMAYLAHMLHLSGKNIEAGKSFVQADELLRKIGGARLYGIWGAFFADFLIFGKRIHEALELTRQNLHICRSYNFVNDIPRCYRCLAAIERIKGNHNEADIHLQKGLELAHDVGMPELEIEAQIEYGRLYLQKSVHKQAMNAGSDVLKLCERTSFLLYEPDAEIILGKAHLAQKDFEQTKKFANSARSKAKKMGHKLAENDAEALLKEIRSKMK